MNQATKKTKSITTTNKKRYTKASVARLHITFGINNTIVTASTTDYHKLFQLSPPCIGFKGPKKPTPYAAHKVMEETTRRLQENHGATSIKSVVVSGAGAAREIALRAIKMPVEEVIDVTPVVHNGCRPPARRSKG